MEECVRDIIVIKIFGERRLRIDGVDSMSKIIVEYDIEVGTVEDAVEKFRKLVEEVKENPFRFI